MNTDFAALYISGNLELNYKINRGAIFTELLDYLQNKGIKTETLEGKDKKGYMHRESYIENSVNPNIHWRIIIIQKKIENYRKIFISLRPAFRDPSQYRYMKSSDVLEIAEKDIETIKVNLGTSVQLCINGENINFHSFSYSAENKIDISRWEVAFNQSTIEYESFSNSVNIILDKIAQTKPFSFRVINLSDSKNTEKNMGDTIIAKLGQYGSNMDQYYNRYNYTSIPSSSNKDRDVVNIILIEKNDNQSYMDSKEFFLNHGLPFQHIRLDGNLKNGSNSYAFNMVIMEIYKKTHPHDLYLIPDHFINEKIACFIYIYYV